MPRLITDGDAAVDNIKRPPSLHLSAVHPHLLRQAQPIWMPLIDASGILLYLEIPNGEPDGIAVGIGGKQVADFLQRLVTEVGIAGGILRGDHALRGKER